MPVLKNPKHELFAQQVAKGVALDDAYEAVGYARSSKNAARLRKNEGIQRRIEEILSQAAVIAQVEVAQVLDELAKIAFSDVRRAIRWGDGILVRNEETGEMQLANGVALIASDKIDDRTAAAISEISQTATGGLKIKFHDKKGALEMLGKHLGMFVERRVNLTADLESLSDNQRRTAIAWLTGTLADLEHDDG